MSRQPNVQPSAQLVFGLVAAVGTDQSAFQTVLQNELTKYGCAFQVVRVTDFFGRVEGKPIAIKIDTASEYRRIATSMDAGNAWRAYAHRGDVLALFAVSAMARERESHQSSAHSRRLAHVVRSLKHPHEVATLRQIYGPAFFLIAVYSTEKERIDYLVRDKDCSREEALDLNSRDQSEKHELGQHTREVFALADVFIRHDPSHPEVGKEQIRRFLRLVFGHPYTTPDPDEYAMFLAFAASLRSGQLGRQVGAVVLDAHGDVIATGANDVPRFGGGLYWPGSEDQRDHVWGHDSNERKRNELIEKIVVAVHAESRPGRPLEEPLGFGKRVLRETGLFDITEYGRAVHAELEALLCCARVGASARNGSLFSTTFPCHNCAKHVVAAGIREVRYVEPYPKSLAQVLHPDSISVEVTRPRTVSFLPFVGVGPRRYVDLFSVGLGAGTEIVRKKDGRIVSWDEKRAIPRMSMPIFSFEDSERLAIQRFESILEGGRTNVGITQKKGQRRKP